MTLDDLFVGLILREKDNSHFYKITQKDSNQSLMNRILTSSTGGYHRIAIDVLRFKNNIEIVNNLPFNDAKFLAQNRHVCGIYNDRLRNENKFLFYDKRWILQSEGVEDSQEYCDNLSMQDLDSEWYIVYNVRQYFNKGKGLLNKKIVNIGFYYDGGTIKISFEDNSNLFIDYKIVSNTTGQFYNVYPNDNEDDKIPMSIENMGQLLKEIIRYYEHR